MSFDDYIFVSPGFFRGAARAFDIGASLRESSYLYSRTPEEADANAIESDWILLNRDLAAAGEIIEREQKAEEEASAAA